MVERILLEYRDLGNLGEIVISQTLKRKIDHQIGQRPSNPRELSVVLPFPGQSVLICNTRFTEPNPKSVFKALPPSPLKTGQDLLQKP